MVGRAASLLSRRRWAAFAVLAVVVVAWYVAAPHMPHVGLWPAVVIVSIAVMPLTLLLVLIALPLREMETPALLIATGVFVALAVVFAELRPGTRGELREALGGGVRRVGVPPLLRARSRGW